MDKIVVVGSARPVEGMMPVPGREIDAEFQPPPAAGVGEFPDNVARSVFVRAPGHGVVPIPAGPQAEAVVVLAGEDGPAHPGVPDAPGPLVRIQPRGSEAGGRLRTVPPLPAGEGVHRKMDKGVKLHPLPRQLPLGRDDENGPRVKLKIVLCFHKLLRIKTFFKKKGKAPPRYFPLY